MLFDLGKTSTGLAMTSAFISSNKENLANLALLFKEAVKKLCCSFENLEPDFMAEKAVNLIRKNKSFNISFAQCSQALNHIRCLDEIDIPVIIPMDEKHR